MNIGQRAHRLVVEPIDAPSPSAQPPDYAEPIVGWRLWLVVDRREGIRLASVTYDVAWPVGQPLEAGCLDRRRSGAAHNEFHGHAAPRDECQCGIYAVADPVRLSPYLDTSYPGKDALYRVIGTVALWGIVVAAERGWRGALAYPSRIFVPRLSGEADAVAEALHEYDVPVELLDAGRRTPATTAELVVAGRSA